MAFLRVTEYADLAKDVKGNILLAGKEPNLGTQKLANTGGAVNSTAFGDTTKFVMISTDSICAYKIGLAAVATVANDRLAAGERIYCGVNPGDRVSVILDT